MNYEMIKEQAEMLETRYNNLGKQYRKYHEAISALEKLDEIDTEDIVAEIKERMRAVNDVRNEILKQQTELQEKCDHNDGCGYDYTGHDSHKDYYRCNICGKEISV